MRVLLSCGILALAVCPAASADTSHWTATSTASIAVTGNISIHPDRVVFGNGAEIRIKPAAADRPDVYRVDPPANPQLVNGNRLCGENAPTFIVLGRSDGADNLARSSSLFLKVFEGPEMPAAWTAEGMIGGGPGLCAILNFERAAGAGAATLGRDDVRRVQESLNALGYDAGPVDGAMGPRTRSALRALQQKAGLPVTGAPDEETLEALARASDNGPTVARPMPDGPPQIEPSFNCGQARSQVEKTICAVPKLGALDAELARAYRARTALVNGAEAEEEVQRQRAWMAFRDRCGTDIACLEQAYEGRIAVLAKGSEQSSEVGFSPEELVRAIYATLDAPGPQQRMEVMRGRDQRARYFVPELVALFDAHDNEECIDFSLNLNGQDFDSSEITRTLEVKNLGEADRAIVDATFTRFGDRNHFRYEFIRDGGDWKIADIASLGRSVWRLSEFSCGPANEGEHVSDVIASAPAKPATTAPMIVAVDNTRSPAPVLADRSKTPAPLSAFRDCETCPEMVALTAGSYWMGATDEDAKLPFTEWSIPSELPRHKVTFDYSFAIGKFTVTVAEFAAFVDETGYQQGGECFLRIPDSGPNAGQFIGKVSTNADEYNRGKHVGGKPGGMVLVEYADFRTPGTEVTVDHPAACISRNEANAYLAWLTEKSGRKYRLPTEAEWEYAARAGEELPYYYGGGQKDLCQYGNFADRDSVYGAAIMAKCAEKPSLEYTYPVGSFKPNNWGLHDMVGNVFEFVEDCYFPDYAGAPTDGSPWMLSDRHPESQVNGKCRQWTLRSYFFDSPDVALRSAARCVGIDSWDVRSNGTGLRVAVSLTEGAWDLK